MVTLSTSLSLSIFPYLNFLPQLKPKNNTLVLKHNRLGWRGEGWWGGQHLLIGGTQMLRHHTCLHVFWVSLYHVYLILSQEQQGLYNRYCKGILKSSSVVTSAQS